MGGLLLAIDQQFLGYEDGFHLHYTKFQMQRYGILIKEFNDPWKQQQPRSGLLEWSNTKRVYSSRRCSGKERKPVKPLPISLVVKRFLRMVKTHAGSPFATHSIS